MFEIGGPGVPVIAEQPSVAPPAALPAKAVAAQAAPSSATDVRALLGQLNARRKAVKAELKTKGALERELAQLERLMRAAKTELDNVRRLRAAG
jgi:hypothetical protein